MEQQARKKARKSIHRDGEKRRAKERDRNEELKMSGFHREESLGGDLPNSCAGKFRVGYGSWECQVGTERFWKNLEARSALECAPQMHLSPLSWGLKSNSQQTASDFFFFFLLIFFI